MGVEHAEKNSPFESGDSCASKGGDEHRPPQNLDLLVWLEEQIHRYFPNGGAKWCFTMVKSVNKNHLKQTKKQGVIGFLRVPGGASPNFP